MNMIKKHHFFTDKDNIINFSRFIIAIGLVVYLVIYIDLNSILSKLGEANYLVIVIVFLLSFLNLFLQFKKWKLVTYYQLNIDNDRDVIHSLFYGISAGVITPMKAGEFVARSIPFKNKSVVEVSIATLIDKTIPLIIILVAGSILSVNYLLSMKIVSALYIVIIIAIVLLPVLIVSIAHNNNKSVVKRIKRKLKEINWINKIVQNFEVIKLLRGTYLVRLIVLSILFHLTFTTQMAILLIAFSHNYDFLLFLYIANLIVFVQIIIPPVAFGELGIREGAAVYFVQSFGMDPSVGFNAAFLLFIFNFIMPSFYGMYFLASKRK